MEKILFGWMKLKEELRTLHHWQPHIKIGDIWWSNMGINIGSEVDGKGKNFTRPVLILTKLSRSTYFVIPTTSKPKEGNWYVPINSSGRIMYACVHQARTIDYKRIRNKLGNISPETLKTVKDAFRVLHGL